MRLAPTRQKVKFGRWLTTVETGILVRVKLLYKPLGLLVSMLGGMLAASLFKQLWRLLARESEAPPRRTKIGPGVR